MSLVPSYTLERRETRERKLFSQSSQLKRTPQDSVNEFIIRKLNPLIGSSRFQIHLCILAYAIVVREFPREAVMKLQPAQFP